MAKKELVAMAAGSLLLTAVQVSAADGLEHESLGNSVEVRCQLASSDNSVAAWWDQNDQDDQNGNGHGSCGEASCGGQGGEGSCGEGSCGSDSSDPQQTRRWNQRR